MLAIENLDKQSVFRVLIHLVFEAFNTPHLLGKHALLFLVHSPFSLPPCPPCLPPCSCPPGFSLSFSGPLSFCPPLSFVLCSSSNTIYCANGAPTTMTRKSHSFLRYIHTYNYYELSFISVLATYYLRRTKTASCIQSASCELL